MGSETRLAVAPRFRIRAVGSLVQKPGCPEWSTRALGPERLDYLCRGECYNPSDARLRITRIEIVRIRPQARRSEEHTSELQSRLHLVCRLLLEKKKDQGTPGPVPARRPQ